MDRIKILILIGIINLRTSYSQSSPYNYSFEKIDALSSTNLDLALNQANEKLRQAKSIKSKIEFAEAYSLLSSIYMMKSMPEKAILLADTAMLLSQQLVAKKLLAYNYSTLGSCYQNQSDFPNAIKHHNKSLEIALNNKYEKQISTSLRSLAKISSIQEKYDQSLIHLKQLQNEIPVFNDKREQALLHISYGEYFGYIRKVDSALYHNQKAFHICKENNIPYTQAWAQALMAINYAGIDLNKSLGLMLDAQSIFDTLPTSKSIFSITNIGNIGEVFRMFATDDKLLKTFNVKGYEKSKAALLKESEKYMLRGLKLAKEKNSKHDIITASGNLANLYSNMGNYKSAFEYYTIYHSVSDSVYSQKNKNAIARLESEKEILSLEALNQKKTRTNIVLLALALGALAFGFMINRSYKQKQKLQLLKINELENEKKIAAADSLLKGQQEERSRIAQDLHDGLGGMLNGIKYSINNMKGSLMMSYDDSILFEKSIGQLDNVITELRRVSHNLMPDALLKLGLHDALIDYINSMKSETTKINFQSMGTMRVLSNDRNLHIYRIIQELITNAIKHGEAKNILVQMTYASENILIDVDDDGKGFNVNQTDDIGIGLKNISQRIDYLNGSINFDSSSTGTSVYIDLKI